MRILKQAALMGVAVLAAGMVSASLVNAASSTSDAAAATRPGPWEPSTTPPFHHEAGEVCDFELDGSIVRNREFTRVVKTFPDGSPRVREYVGTLVIEFTNVDTGESAIRDASGFLRMTHLANGDRVAELYGHGAATIRRPNPSYPPGDYIMHGYHVLRIHPDGTREFTQHRGPVEDMCQTLA